MTHNKSYNQVDLVAAQNARLRSDDDQVQFLRDLTTFGAPEHRPTREEQEKTMKDIFTWGAMGPYDANDYTKKKAELANKIRKMHRCFVTESRDNFRNPYLPRSGKVEDDITCQVGVCVRCKQPGRFLRFLMGQVDEGVKFENDQTRQGQTNAKFNFE